MQMSVDYRRRNNMDLEVDQKTSNKKEKLVLRLKKMEIVIGDKKNKLD